MRIQNWLNSVRACAKPAAARARFFSQKRTASEPRALRSDVVLGRSPRTDPERPTGSVYSRGVFSAIWLRALGGNGRGRGREESRGPGLSAKSAWA